MLKNRYFIALIPPSPLFEKALDLKKYLSERFQTRAALRSPPHITLHMPFEWKSTREEELIESLATLSTQLKEIRVDFHGFGSFPPGVIFIQAELSGHLEKMQRTIHQYCKRELNIFNADYKDLPFHPHLTLAFRDLKKPAFKLAWEEFKDREFNETFMADRIWLLKHDGEKWNPFKDFNLPADS